MAEGRVLLNPEQDNRSTEDKTAFTQKRMCSLRAPAASSRKRVTYEYLIF